MLRRRTVSAIALAVEGDGGSLEDVGDLIRVWERLVAQPRVDRMRYEASHVRCCCMDGGVPTEATPYPSMAPLRCGRCYGMMSVTGGPR